MKNLNKNFLFFLLLLIAFALYGRLWFQDRLNSINQVRSKNRGQAPINHFWVVHAGGPEWTIKLDIKYLGNNQWSKGLKTGVDQPPSKMNGAPAA